MSFSELFINCFRQLRSAGCEIRMLVTRPLHRLVDMARDEYLLPEALYLPEPSSLGDLITLFTGPSFKWTATYHDSSPRNRTLEITEMRDYDPDHPDLHSFVVREGPSNYIQLTLSQTYRVEVKRDLDISKAIALLLSVASYAGGFISLICTPDLFSAETRIKEGLELNERVYWAARI